MITIDACKTCEDICCLKTTYKLTNEDVALMYQNDIIPKLIHQDGFMIFPKPCQFWDSGCTIYEHRPYGCRVYPIVWNNRCTVDHQCPGYREVTMDEIYRHCAGIHGYMTDILSEMQLRLL